MFSAAKGEVAGPASKSRERRARIDLVPGGNAVETGGNDTDPAGRAAMNSPIVSGRPGLPPEVPGGSPGTQSPARNAKGRDLASRRRCDPERLPNGGFSAPEGFTVLFTGLSGAGKSTLANALAALLSERSGRQATLLDGDIVRTRLSSELGFSREDRETNLRRIGLAAAEVARQGGIAICAVIAPYATGRRRFRETVEAAGRYVEVWVSTPLAVCEARDPKGLYARARAGLIERFTGIDDPYERPRSHDMEIDTTTVGPDLAARRILAELEKRGPIGRSAAGIAASRTANPPPPRPHAATAAGRSPVPGCGGKPGGGAG